MYKELIKPFEKKAYSVDNSRGFPLTSLKAQYIKERLNEVVGIFGWKFVEIFKTENNNIICHGILTIQLEDKIRNVYATGGSIIKKNLSDSYKGAATDSLSKAASFIGVGNDVFKGNINLSTINDKQESSPSVKMPECLECGAPMKLSKNGKRYICTKARWKKEGDEWTNSGCKGNKVVESFVEKDPTCDIPH